MLVNNAGIIGGARTVDELDADVMLRTFDTNVFGIVRVTQAALPLLRASSNAVIVNVASGVGWPRALQDPARDEFPVAAVPYASSKSAVITATVQYAKALPGMRVNVSDPGYTSTDLNGHSGHQTVTEGTDATVALATHRTGRARRASSTTATAASPTDPLRGSSAADGDGGIGSERAGELLRAEARDLGAGSGDELLVGVGVAEEAPAAGDGFGQEHPGLAREGVVACGASTTRATNCSTTASCWSRSSAPALVSTCTRT